MTLRKELKAVVALFALTIAVSSPNGTLACHPPPGYPEKLRLPHKQTAEVMAKAASYVELVEVVGFSNNFEFATRPNQGWPDFPPLNTPKARAAAREEWKNDGAALIHYRVLETLKGPKRAGFNFSGLRDDPQLKQPLRQKALPLLMGYINQTDLADLSDYNMCARPIQGGLGRKYLLFRDGRGHVLAHPNPTVNNGVLTNLYPSIVEVQTRHDAWVLLVRGAVHQD